MKAVTFQGIKDVKVKEVPSPKIEKSDDIVYKSHYFSNMRI